MLDDDDSIGLRSRGYALSRTLPPTSSATKGNSHRILELRRADPEEPNVYKKAARDA
jgi:hypothetical protein